MLCCVFQPQHNVLGGGGVVMSWWNGLFSHFQPQHLRQKNNPHCRAARLTKLQCAEWFFGLFACFRVSVFKCLLRCALGSVALWPWRNWQEVFVGGRGGVLQDKDSPPQRKNTPPLPPKNAPGPPKDASLVLSHCTFVGGPAQLAGS